jgi:hypothetical protein
MAFYARYMHFSADLNANGTRKVDEAETTRLLERNYEVQEAPPGKLSKFMLKACLADWSRDDFELRLERYNEEVQLADHVESLASYGVICPQDFLKYTEDFVEYYRDHDDCRTHKRIDSSYADDREEALEMLELSEGNSTDWTCFEGYSRHGIEFLEMVVSVMEENSSVKDSAVAIQAHKDYRMKALALPAKKRKANEINAATKPEVRAK